MLSGPYIVVPLITFPYDYISITLATKKKFAPLSQKNHPK